MKSLLSRFQSRPPARPLSSAHQTEVEHWKAVVERAESGLRQFWLNHPRVHHHYRRKALVEGLAWQPWVTRRFDGPPINALELGCGDGLGLERLVKQGLMQNGYGLDLEESRYRASDDRVHFIAADVNSIELEENRYDLIFAHQSFHHFEALEHIMKTVNRALTPRGVFVLDEFVGPARFQWTSNQIAWTAHLLALMPRNLRIYTNGIEKREEGRSSVEEVIRVCPSEAIRSNEIPAQFALHFDPIAQLQLGGTIQHLLYSGIVHNFPDNDEATDLMIDSVDAVESSLIGYGILPSDFMLLVGQKRAEPDTPRP